MISGKRIHLSFIWSFMTKLVNTHEHYKYISFLFINFLNKWQMTKCGASEALWILSYAMDHSNWKDINNACCCKCVSYLCHHHHYWCDNGSNMEAQLWKRVLVVATAQQRGWQCVCTDSLSVLIPFISDIHALDCHKMHLHKIFIYM